MTIKHFVLASAILTVSLANTFAVADSGHGHDKAMKKDGGMMMEDGKIMEGDMGKMDGMMKDKHADAMTKGTLRKVDTEARTLTIKHGPIKNLGMPPMTMVFQTEDSVDLSELEVGDKVEFKVVDKSGKMTVTEIKAAN